MEIHAQDLSDLLDTLAQACLFEMEPRQGGAGVLFAVVDRLEEHGVEGVDVAGCKCRLSKQEHGRIIAQYEGLSFALRTKHTRVGRDGIVGHLTLRALAHEDACQKAGHFPMAKNYMGFTLQRKPSWVASISPDSHEVVRRIVREHVSLWQGREIAMQTVGAQSKAGLRRM